jgi:hypothetical protein
LEATEPANIFPEDPTMKSLGEEMRLVISRLQENVRIRRAITFHTDYCIHPFTQVDMALMFIALILTESDFKLALLNFTTILKLKEKKQKMQFTNSLMIWPLKSQDALQNT